MRWQDIELERAGVDRDRLQKAIDEAVSLRSILTIRAQQANTDEARMALEAASTAITDYLLPELKIGVDDVEQNYRETVS